MPTLQEYCEIRTDSGIYRDWVSVQVGYSAAKMTERAFTLIVAEPSLKSFLLKPKDRVDVALAGELVIQQGYLTFRQTHLDAARHLVRVSGISQAGAISHVSVNLPGGGNQFRGYTLDAIANKVLQPLGLKFRIENGPDGAHDPFPNVSVHHGESPYEMITRLCRQRGMWWRTEADGTIVAGRKDPSGSKVAFEEGRNILSIDVQISMPWASNLTVRAQQPGSNSLFGKKAAEVSATAKVQNGVDGNTVKHLAEMPLSVKEAQTRANMAVSDLQESLLQVQLTYQGWLRPSDGKLWTLSDPVTIKSPTAFPTDNGEVEMYCWGVTYTQDAQAGTTTTLELRNKLTFGMGLQDATQQDQFYSQPATPARPDNPT